jgi:uncharacterized protein YjdB
MKIRALFLFFSFSALAAISFSSCGYKGNHLTSIAISPPSPVVSKGTVLLFIVTATFTDGMTVRPWTIVTWSSDNTAVATVASNGVVTALSAGTAKITAIDEGHTDITSSVTIAVTETPLVSIDVAPSNSIISLGTTTQFTVTWTLADGTTLPNTTVPDLRSSVNWRSSHAGVATISNSAGSEGLATAIAAGTTQIVATDPVTNISGITTLTITP